MIKVIKKMNLAVSIGNSNIRLELRAGTRVLFHKIVCCEDVDKIGRIALSAVSERSISDCIISSVNPALNDAVTNGLSRYVKNPPIFLKIGAGFKLDYSHYDFKRLGMDRAICCEAAAEVVNPPFIVIDFGTATTINVVDQRHRFIGGAIIPGIQLSLFTLNTNTALLPAIPPKSDIPLIGGNTEECMLSGSVRGTALLIDKFITEIWLNLGESGRVMITGGNAQYTKCYIQSGCTFDQNLIMDGIFSIHKRLCDQKNSAFAATPVNDS